MTTGIIAIAAGLAIGLAAIGIAIGQGILASKAVELAIMDTICVLTFVIAIVLSGKI